MHELTILLALNGAVVLTISMAAGLFLYRAILRERSDEARWHLVHSGGTGRGVMLIALAAIISLPDLPLRQLEAFVWLMLVFVWTSMLAMIVAAISGKRGLRFDGSITNKLVYALYAVGTVAVFPACVLLIFGLIKAL